MTPKPGVTTMKAATRKTRKPLTLATGSCRWAVQPSLTGASGVLVIKTRRGNGQTVEEAYHVEENRDQGRLLGYRLVKPDGVMYDLPTDLTDCTCPDFTINRASAPTAELRLCKHCRAVRAALVKLG